MREYITKEQALRRFSYFGREIPKDLVFEVIASMQEEIVRCKDCKHWKWIEWAKEYRCTFRNTAFNTRDNDFCSFGERGEDE